MLYETIIKENEAKVRAIILTEEEKEAALFEGQKKKYFNLKHKHHWNEDNKKGDMEKHCGV